MSDEDDAPKSALELALARLQKKDRDAGVQERPLSDEQRTRMADIRRVYDARLAEREILHQSDLAKARDPEAFEQLEKDYRRDRERTQAERERKLGEVRGDA
jgi:hypothetical protein